jgi:starvation-inducible DNA-binding protein
MMSTEVLQAKTAVENVKTGIQNADRAAVANGLSRALADTYALYIKTQGFHWNVVGPLFYGLHKLTEAQYEEMAAAIDEIAERTRALGHPAPAGFAAFAKLTGIKDSDGTKPGDRMIRELVADHETVARSLRELADLADGAGDAATADLATRRLDAHEKAVWMLRALIAE